ncbi:HNH endonuclease [Pedobacter sandarakinus]|uniref:HNH endonuclease n=1 Tax=Pedobacter sandarakinus TaxID=353156 RepID=UPI002245B312|nr:HNH endonuclease signature motif containing protein [Pedobacter sandarakinus]MCX2573643.1 HNH endonuclease signature motif containing protein [Pedobacter sandarakinus]
MEDLFQIKNVEEAKTLKAAYMADEELAAKNKKGNNMYSRSFDLYIEYLAQLFNNEEGDVVEILASAAMVTEKQTLMLMRIGQGKYREDLIKIWGECSISKFPDVSLLVASHIQPWRKRVNQERIDPYNGLLLLPNYDKVFDKGLIKFLERWVQKRTT